MSIDVALSTRRGVGRDTYSLPQKRGYAASGTSMDMPPLHKRHLFFAAKTRLRPGGCIIIQFFRPPSLCVATEIETMLKRPFLGNLAKISESRGV